MSDATTTLAALRVEGLDTGQLEVIECAGRDALSTTYAFTLLCSSADAHLDARRMACRPATLRLASADWENAYSGLLFSFQKLRSIDGVTFYKAALSPRFRLLSLTRHNQVFLNKTLPQILEGVLKECGIVQYELRLMRIYEPMEYVCQYNETHFNFVSRWMEHFGIYYFFEETEQGEKLVMTDTRESHVPVSGQPFPYRLASGLDEREQSRSVYDFVTEETIVPRTVVLKDYNPLRPDLDLMVEAEADPQGVGKTYHYGDHYQTTEQGQALAAIRAEELVCGKTVYRGQSGCLPLRAGGLFSLSGHPDEVRNAAYLVAGVRHEARRSSPLNNGLSPLTGFEGEAGYRNAFEAREASLQFRPPLAAEKTRITGVLCAKIDAESSGQYAELDSMGRYKVRLPFDLAGEPDGHASSWLRLAEPYAGSNYGMHFPLHKGVEVLLTFVNADPDRPVIASAVHNGENKNPIRDTNAKVSGITTAANNQIIFNDTKGQESVGMWSPYHDSGMAVGAVKKGGGGSLAQWTKGDNDTVTLGDNMTLVAGAYSQAVLGATNYCYLGTTTNIAGPLTNNLNFGAVFNCNCTSALTWDFGTSTDLSPSKDVLGQESVTIGAGCPAATAAILAAKVAFAAALGGVLAITAGSFVTTQSFSKDGILYKNGAWEGVGIGLDVAGVAAAAAAALTAKVAVNSIVDATKALRAANILLNNRGIAMLVNNDAQPLATFALHVGETLPMDTYGSIPGFGSLPQPMPDSSSSFQISGGGLNISLRNQLENSMVMDAVKGTTIRNAEGGSATFDALGARIYSNPSMTGGRITLSEAQAAMGCGPGMGLFVTDATTTIMDPGTNAMIEVGETGITMTAVSVKVVGDLTVTGAITRIG